MRLLLFTLLLFILEANFVYAQQPNKAANPVVIGDSTLHPATAIITGKVVPAGEKKGLRGVN
ncbi:MAG: hypothetical protein PVI44_08655, partial [Balneolaceae bacterium]